MIKIRANRVVEIPFSSFKFSGGEIQVKLNPDALTFYPDVISITANIHSSDDLMELCLLTDALRRRYSSKLELICPYLPYARQDRVCYPGEALSLKVFCNIINALEFSSVEVWDVHSDVSLALLNNVINREQNTFYEKVIPHIRMRDTILVSPDAGAQKKIYETAKRFNLKVMKADKVRDPKDGSITGTNIACFPENFQGTEDFLIMDDICDGGRTFIELHKVIRPLTTGKIYLYVTHGIFSKGMEVLAEFDKVFVANLFPRSSWFKRTEQTDKFDKEFVESNPNLVVL